MPLDREKARQALLTIGVFDDDWKVGQPTVTEVLDAIEPCVGPRLAEVDVRLVSEAEWKVAEVRRLAHDADEIAAENDPPRPYGSVATPTLRRILDAPS